MTLRLLVGFRFIQPEGGYFVVVDFSPFYSDAGITVEDIEKLSPESPLDDRPDVIFAKWLIKEVGVAGIPMYVL